MRWAIACALAGCLSEPTRPHGVGPKIAAGSIVRHRVAVADLDGDGYDDLVTWGNEGGPGIAPTVFVYWGGEILETPDVRLDLTIDDPDAAPVVDYEAIDASIFVSASDAMVRGIVALSAQHDGSNNGPCYAMFVPFTGRTQGAVQRTQSIGRGWGGMAPASGREVALARDATRGAFPARNVLVGEAFDTFAFIAPLDMQQQGATTGFAYPDNEYLQEVLELPPVEGSEDLLVITNVNAFRTRGDPDPRLAGGGYSAQFALGAPVQLPGGNRFARGRAIGGEFWAITNYQFTIQGVDIFDVIDVPATGDPRARTVDAVTMPDDVAIADVGGGPEPDAIELASGNLGVYRDLAPDPTDATNLVPAAILGSRDELLGYDLLAVGHFHGGAQLAIYAIDTTDAAQPLLCYRLVTPTTLARCTSE